MVNDSNSDAQRLNIARVCRRGSRLLTVAFFLNENRQQQRKSETRAHALVYTPRRAYTDEQAKARKTAPLQGGGGAKIWRFTMKKKQNTHPIDIYAIIENGGATLDKNGMEVNFLRGYQVSKHDIAILKVSEAEKIARTVSKLLKRIARNEFVGVWVNEGRVYVDISEHVSSQGAALRIGRARRQISVYEWATGNCIEC